MTTPTTDAVAAVRRAVEGLQSGAAQVIDSTAEVRYDEDGQRYVVLTLELAPPGQGEETWPTDDIYTLTEAVRRRLSESDIVLPVELGLTSREPDDGARQDLSSGDSRGHQDRHGHS